MLQLLYYFACTVVDLLALYSVSWFGLHLGTYPITLIPRWYLDLAAPIVDGE